MACGVESRVLQGELAGLLLPGALLGLLELCLREARSRGWRRVCQLCPGSPSALSAVGGMAE